MRRVVRRRPNTDEAISNSFVEMSDGFQAEKTSVGHTKSKA
jgi:hypothetical protein